MKQESCRREPAVLVWAQVVSPEEFVIRAVRGDVAGAVAYCDSSHGCRLQNAMMNVGLSTID